MILAEYLRYIFAGHWADRGALVHRILLALLSLGAHEIIKRAAV